MKKLFRLRFIALCLLSSCYSLGVDKAPEQPKAFVLSACSGQVLERQSQGLTWKLSYIGPSPALVTAKQPWGAVTRFVYPYTQYTDLFELQIDNTSARTLWLNTDTIALETPDEAFKPLELDFFKRAWPSGAVSDQQQLIDRSLAIAEVTRHLFYSHGLLPGETYTAKLVFPQSQGRANQLNLGDWKLGDTAISESFCLELQPQT